MYFRERKTPSAVQTRGLRMRYGPTDVLHGVDLQVRRGEVLAGLVGRLDTTILLTTHDLDEAEKLADRIMILVNGAIVAEGTAAQLAKQVAGKAEVRFSRDGDFYVEQAEDATQFVRELFEQYGKAIGDLEVRRPRLEDVYLTMVRENEVAA